MYLSLVLVTCSVLLVISEFFIRFAFDLVVWLVLGGLLYTQGGLCVGPV